VPGTNSDGSTDGDIDTFVNSFLAASRVLMNVSARSIAAVEETVTLTQFRTLVVLDRNGQLNLQGLAGLLDVNASTAMRMVDRLIAVGLVSRTENPANRREVILTLTDEGRRIVGEVMARRRDEISQIVMAMQTSHHEQLVAALQAFADAGGDSAAGRVPGTLSW
jgi:DNA-binding MarR family transcriptional regulator